MIIASVVEGRLKARGSGRDHTKECRPVRRSCYGCRRSTLAWLCDLSCVSTHNGVRVFTNYNGNISLICAECMLDYYRCGRHGRRRIPAHVRKAVMQRDGKVCQLCHANIVGAFHLDHIEPYVQGGPDTVDNLRVTCPSCNLGRPKPVRTQPVKCDESATRHARISLALAGRQPRARQRLTGGGP